MLSLRNSHGGRGRNRRLAEKQLQQAREREGEEGKGAKQTPTLATSLTAAEVLRDRKVCYVFPNVRSHFYTMVDPSITYWGCDDVINACKHAIFYQQTQKYVVNRITYLT